MKQALELALEALQVATTPLAKDRQEVLRAITAIKEALAQPEQEPININHKHKWFRTGEMKVGQMRCISCGTWGQEEMPQRTEQEPVVWAEKVGGIGFKEPMPNANYKVIATIAPQRKPLTDEQIDSVMKSCINDWGLRQFARAIEVAHGIKE